MLEKEFQWFLDNQKALATKYANRYIVIVGDKVVGDYESEGEAYHESIKTLKLGTFLIQLCTADKSSFTQTYYTQRVTFHQPS
jgi:hypothetical protein